MSIGNDLKEFTAAFATGWKLATPDKESLAEKNAKGVADAYKQGVAGADNGATPAPQTGTDTPGKAREAADPVIRDTFMSTVKEGGLTNPYALAATEAYGVHESGFSRSNATGSWSDPSTSGQAGTSGGLLSWRADRLDKMRAFTKDEKNPAVGQAKFFLNENPDMIKELQSAKSVAEANDILARNWKFAGWNKPGGEKANRFATANSILPRYQGGSATGAQAANATPTPPIRPAVMTTTEPQVEAPDPDAGYYAEGGAVEDPNAGAPMPPPRPGAIDASGAPPAAAQPATAPQRPDYSNQENAGAREFAAYGDDYDPKLFVNRANAGKAASAGLDFIQKAFGFGEQQGAVDTGGPKHSEAAVAAYASNAGAMPKEDVEAVRNTVDPKRQLTPEQRSIAGLNAVYNYWISKGEPDKAARVAGGMLMQAKRAVAAYGVAAQAAAENGDVAKAGELISRASAEIPDGTTVKVTGASPEGLTYQVFDEQGRITEKGAAKLDDVMKIATGMQNGTAWFTSMGMLARSAPSKDEKRSAAIADFENSRGENPDGPEFIDTLTPEARAKFLKLSPQDQVKYRTEHNQRVKLEAAQERFAIRQEASDYWKTIAQQNREAETERKQGNFNTKRDDKLQERVVDWTLKLKDLEDRNTRQQTSIAEMREIRDLRKKIMQASLDKKVNVPVPGSSGSNGRGGSAAERKERAIDTGTGDALAANANQPGEYTDASEEGSPATSATPQGTEVAGPTMTQMRRGQAIQLDAEYKRAQTDKGRSESEFNNDDYTKMTDKLKEIASANPTASKLLVDAEGKPQPIGQRMAEVAYGLTRTNNLSPDAAYRMTMKAINPDSEGPRIVNGRVMVEGEQPVIMSPEQLSGLATLRGMAIREYSRMQADAKPTPPPAGRGSSRVTSPPATGGVRGGRGAMSSGVISTQ